MSETITSRFDYEVICAGVLKLISEPNLLDKFHKNIDPEYFFHGDKSLKIRGFRKMLTGINSFCKDGLVNQISYEFLESKFKMAVQSEENAEAYSTFVWIHSDENVRKKATDAGCFTIFMDYLKVTELLKWSKPFQTEYREGNIGKAIDSMRDLLPKIDNIKISEDYQFKAEDLDNLLPHDANSIKDSLLLDCTPLDFAMGGFEPQTLNLFITVTNGGKSMMAHHILRQCVKQRKHVHITCVEDRPKSFARRIVAALTGIEIKKLKTEYHCLSMEERRLVSEAKKAINEYIKADFVYGESIESIQKRKLDYDFERKARGLEPCLVDIVDYTAHVAHMSAGDKKYEKVHMAYSSRKDFALKNNKIAFDFAQINREGNHKQNDAKLLTHADLAAAYDLSQVCDTIISINRNLKEKDANTALLFVCKGRDSEAGGQYTVKTDFGRARWHMSGNDVIWENPSSTQIIIPTDTDAKPNDL